MSDNEKMECQSTGRVSIQSGVHGLPKLELSHCSGSSAEVYLHGAHVTSWKNSRMEEQLFMSRESLFAQDQAIRGGIPVVFPQFADEGPLPKHGLARTRPWDVVSGEVTADGRVAVSLQLISSPATLPIWPRRFRLLLSLLLGADTLTVKVGVANTGTEAFEFQSVLHTYFRVSDIEQTAVSGLKGVQYIDSLRERAREVETRDEIRFTGETDRIYLATPDTLSIADGAERTVEIAKSGMPDAVVWNPWIEKAKRLKDFGDDEYRTMVCVETGLIEPRKSLAAGEEWTGETRYTAR